MSPVLHLAGAAGDGLHRPATTALDLMDRLFRS